MPFIGNKPSAVPLTSADIADGIITSAKIADGSIVNADINATSAITLNKLSGNPNFRNRIINGDMVLDQRNSGSAVTVNSAARIYGVDRFFGYGSAADGVFTIQQSSTAPTGFTNSAIITTTTADASVGASQYYLLGHTVEGFNTADLNWGTANAKTVTLSFWVRSSLTGQFGGSLTNNGNVRSYPFSYTILAANTWEQKTITIAGDTSGTWLTTNGIGINIYWDLGCGSSNIGTAGSWSGSSFFGATGDTKLISTNGATFYITGVQLEAGTSATDFEFLPIDVSLGRCQRYFQQITGGSMGVCWSTTGINFGQAFPVTMRASPTCALTALLTIDVLGVGSRSQSSSDISAMGNGVTPESFNVYCQNFTSLTTGLPCAIITTGGEITFTSEL